MTPDGRSDDVVCRIAAGDLPAEVVWQDERSIAFLDHSPLFKGHVLVAPVAHVADLTALPEEAVAALFGLVRRVAVALPVALGCQGSFTAVNTFVSQSIPHLHVHVVPRTKGDGLRGFFWPRQRYTAGEAARYGSLLREALAEDPGVRGAG